MYPRDRRTFAAEVPYFPDMPDDYYSHHIHKAKADILEKLQQEMWHDRWWMIRIHEEWPTEQELYLLESGYYGNGINVPFALPTYRIYFDIKEVPTEHFVMPEPMPRYESWSTRRVAVSAIDELKHRIKNKLRRK